MKNIVLLFESVKTGVRITAKASRSLFIKRIICVILSSVVPFLALYCTKTLLNELTGDIYIDQAAWGNTLAIIGVLVGINYITQLLSYVLRYTQSIQDDMILGEIRKDLIRKNYQIDFSCFDDPAFFNSMQASNVNSAAVINVVWNFFNSISGLISLVVSIIMLSQYNLVAALVLLALSIPISLVNHKYTQIIFDWQMDHIKQERQKNYFYSISEDPSYVREIKLYNAENELLKQYEDIVTNLIKEKTNVQKRQLRDSSVASVFPYLATFVLLVVCSYQVLDNRSTIGDYTLYSGLIASAMTSIIGVIDSIANMYEDRLKIDDLKKYLERPNAVRDDGELVLDADKPCDLEFLNVTFTYPNTKVPALNNVSFSIRHGEKVCIVGENGAGKSTIIKLILRFYDVNSGKILLNGHDIKDYKLKSLRSGISVLFQNSILFPTTIFENIVMPVSYDSDYNKKRYCQVVKWSGADEIIQKCQEKDNTPIGRLFSQTGYVPSGGEARRIAQSRTFYKKASTVIFDEPSTYIDSIHEQNFYDNIDDICCGKTALFITHNLSTVKFADKVIVIKNGELQEQGNPSDLARKDREFDIVIDHTK